MSRAETTQPDAAAPKNRSPVHTRHTVAAIVYFIYGLFYLFGAQYLVSVAATERGMSGSSSFFVLGAAIAIAFPLLVYNRFAFAFSLWRRSSAQRKTLHISFTLLLGLLVVARVIALVRGGLYAKTMLHTAALLLATLNAACLLWAGLSQPAWITRNSEGTV